MSDLKLLVKISVAVFGTAVLIGGIVYGVQQVDWYVGPSLPRAAGVLIAAVLFGLLAVLISAGLAGVNMDANPVYRPLPKSKPKPPLSDYMTPPPLFPTRSKPKRKPKRKAKRKRKSWSFAVRKRIYEQQGKQCYICGRKLKSCIGKHMHLDHVVPLAKGGADTEKNLQAACPPCNQEKSDKTID